MPPSSIARISQVYAAGGAREQLQQVYGSSSQYQ